MEIQRIVHISNTRCPIQMEVESKCNILNGQVVYFGEKKTLEIADVRFIPLDCVTDTGSFNSYWLWFQVLIFCFEFERFQSYHFKCLEFRQEYGHNSTAQVVEMIVIWMQ